MVKAEMITPDPSYVQNVEPCRDCDAVFMRPKQRGRPPTRCSDCQELFVSERFETTSQDTIDERYSGPAIKLKGDRGDLPKGNEAQCVFPGGCGRIFTSDSACEAHKRYGSRTSCVDPTTLGMEPRERRGIPIWTRPITNDREA